jgi:DNA-directed RNA polymerase subunit H (RpoH/RPB5)
MEEESKIPAGTRLMSEEERLSTLQDLQVTKKELTNMLERMPIANRTQAADRRKKELEEKLMRIERAIETFSKKVVYIAL